MTAKHRHPCTEWFSSLCLQTNLKHMEKQSLICTQKTSFSGATSVQWSDVEHAMCAFSGVCWDYFQVFRWFRLRNESTVKSGIFPRQRFETRFFIYLVEYSVKDFSTTRQYLVNLTCNCWFRMCTQFHQKLVSYKCMLFVDCLVVLREYFVNWARGTKL